jgi:isopenicillin-N N-acyltransferase like protein
MRDIQGSRRIKVVEIRGSPYEMGFQYGSACPEMGTFLDITMQGFGGRDKAREIAAKFIPLYLPAAQEYAPELLEEMKGMADGAGLEFNDVFFLNITYEISVPSLMGCTSFAMTGTATAQGETIAGQNFDFLNSWEDIMVLLKIKPERGPRILAIGPAGAPGLFGFNSAGIALNLNLLRNKESLDPAGGVPSHIILRKALSSETIGEAIGTIASAGRRSAKNYLLSSHQGDIVDVELTSRDIDIQFTEEDIVVHTNYFKSERFKSTDLAPISWPDSYIRYQRLLRLIKQHRGDLSIDLMKQLLQDHNNYPNSICRHPDPKNPLPMGRILKTLVSFICSPKEQKACICLGNPCTNGFAEFYL